MSYQNFRQIKAIEQKNKQRLLEVDPGLDDESGIYNTYLDMNSILTVL